MCLAPLSKGQRAIIMALCPSCMHPSANELVLHKTSPQKPLSGFLPNFTGMFLRGASFKFFLIIVFHEEICLPWQPE